MNLTEWASLPEKEKREQIIQWYRTDDGCVEYESLARKAVFALKAELASVSQVTNVELGGGEVLSADRIPTVRELALDVCTLLSGSGRLSQIPSQFAGFSVRQVNLGDKREAYLRTWKKLFKELRGWDEETTLIWAKKWEDRLAGQFSMVIYHYGPLEVAISSLVDEGVKELIGRRLRDLYNDMKKIVEFPQGLDSQRFEHPHAVQNYDWDETRKRIAQLIESYKKTS